MRIRVPLIVGKMLARLGCPVHFHTDLNERVIDGWVYRDLVGHGRSYIQL